MELCDLSRPLSTNLPLISTTLPQHIRITPNSIQDAHDWRILYHLRSTTKALNPDRIPPLKLKIKRRKTFRVLNVLPASTITSTLSQDQEATQQQTGEVAQLYSHRHGTVISCERQICQTLTWKRKWRVCGGMVDVGGYRWQALQQEEDGNVAPSPEMDEKLEASKSLDDRGKVKGKTMAPGTWIPFLVKREKRSDIWCWRLRDATSGQVGGSGAEDEEEIAALMEEGRLAFSGRDGVNGLGSQKKRDSEY
ncbi:unnamed protein product [Cercospora beticola]|nr:unnamed protein product [Cercospora beticola]